VAAYGPGSLRDPDSAVFASGGHIRRGLVAGPEVGKRGGAADHDASIWCDYRSTCSCRDGDAGAKQDFVRAAPAEGPTEQVLDLGANDGPCSVLAAEHADYLAIGANVPLPEVVDWLGGTRTMYLAEPKP
jgi:hypothetical protein